MTDVLGQVTQAPQPPMTSSLTTGSAPGSAGVVDLTDDDDICITGVVNGPPRPPTPVQQLVRLPPGAITSGPPPKKPWPAGTMLVPVGKVLLKIPGQPDKAKLVNESEVPPDAELIPSATGERN